MLYPAELRGRTRRIQILKFSRPLNPKGIRHDHQTCLPKQALLKREWQVRAFAKEGK